jgi:hypothetical protein
MKRILMLVPIMLLASLALSQTDSLTKNNLARVGQDLLAKDNSILSEMRTVTIHEFEVMVTDSVITKSEMIRLEDRINKFDEMTKHLSKRLQIYNLSTNVLLDSVYRTIVNVYFSDDFCQDDNDETVRKLAVGLAGHDITINTGANKGRFMYIVYCYLIFPIGFGSLASWLLGKAKVNDRPKAWIGTILGLGVLAVFLFVVP